MNEIVLVKPAMEYAEAIMDFRRELLDAGDSFDGCSRLEHYARVEDWLEHLREFASEETCPKGKVPSDTWLAVRKSDGRVVGCIDFRHHIDHSILSIWGGHIGYSVRPSERRKGYAKEMLRLCLLECKAFGLDRVLITCRIGNVASQRTILANGGVFEKDVKEDGKTVRRYWVTLS